MIKLLVIDFDHTALGGYEPYDRFPDGLSRFLDTIQDQGIAWVTNTTWHPIGQDEVFQRSDLRSRPLRMIGRTGLVCGMYHQEELVLDAAWDQSITESQYQYARQFLPKLGEAIRSFPEVDQSSTTFDLITNIHTDNPGLVDDRLHEIPGFDLRAYVEHNADPRQLNVFPSYMSKGSALKRVQLELGVGPEETLVAGDGFNDLPMMHPDVAHHSICPVNAQETVKCHVQAHNGHVATLPFGDGLVQAAISILARCGQDTSLGICL